MSNTVPIPLGGYRQSRAVDGGGGEERERRESAATNNKQKIQNHAILNQQTQTTVIN